MTRRNSIRRVRRAIEKLEQTPTFAFCVWCFRRDQPLDDTSTCATCSRVAQCSGEITT